MENDNRTPDMNRAENQALAQLESIGELMANLENAKEGEKKDDAIEAIYNDPLEVGIKRTYFILLCTGGPAVRIIGDLDEYNEPETARLEFQDWGTPWTDLPLASTQKDVLLEYARQFNFEGMTA